MACAASKIKKENHRAERKHGTARTVRSFENRIHLTAGLVTSREKLVYCELRTVPLVVVTLPRPRLFLLTVSHRAAR